jgi:hypothetical protein
MAEGHIRAVTGGRPIRPPSTGRRMPRRGNRQMGIVALVRQESRAKAVDMTLWGRQSLANANPLPTSLRWPFH